MNVDVCKLKTDFVNKMNDLYNQDVYFLATCLNFPNKFSLETNIKDLSLRIFFEENNFITICNDTVKYCDKSSKRKIRLKTIDLEMPDINIINNYITDETWDKIEW